MVDGFSDAASASGGGEDSIPAPGLFWVAVVGGVLSLAITLVPAFF